ncbi:30S ribosomal protein S11, chloroplastic [Capsicum annuum]|uniref:30S ribosomal protein S11, chloroplastic n=1 Tax=Capsicum annuum TaxID=4072 RepID=A0A2G3AK91_CAPAN|nr:30S ribosomal protein S11, chloroplastic [Capsicum annuum]
MVRPPSDSVYPPHQHSSVSVDVSTYAGYIVLEPIPKISSRRNGHIGSRKGARRIPKGVIHVQASFNNTIVTVTDVRGRVVSWSSAGTSGFKGTRRGTPFAAQTAAANAIRTVVDQGMQRAEVMIKGPGLGRDATL